MECVSRIQKTNNLFGFPVVMIYFWIVVYSFFQELKERDRMNLNSPAEMKRLTFSNV